MLATHDFNNHTKWQQPFNSVYLKAAVNNQQHGKGGFKSASVSKSEGLHMGLMNKTDGCITEIKHPTLRPLNLTSMDFLSSDEVRCSRMFKSLIYPVGKNNQITEKQRSAAGIPAMSGRHCHRCFSRYSWKQCQNVVNRPTPLTSVVRGLLLGYIYIMQNKFFALAQFLSAVLRWPLHCFPEG